MALKGEIEQRAKEYAHRKKLVLGAELGSGAHGIVYEAPSLHRCYNTRSAVTTLIRILTHREQP
jgi:hypothetical protein